MRPRAFETTTFDTCSFETTLIWCLFETTFIWDLFVYDRIHLSLCSFEAMFIWDHIHLRQSSIETTFIWDLFIYDRIHLSLCSFEAMFIWDHIHLNNIHFTPCQSEAVFIYYESHFYDLPSTFLRTFTLSAKTVVFVEITSQMFFLYAVTFLFWKATQCFSCDFFDQRKMTFFSRLSFLVENWNYCGVLSKETGMNAKQVILWRGLKLHFRGCNASFKARGMKSFLASAVF